MAKTNPTHNFYAKRNTTVPVLQNNAPIVGLSTEFTNMNIVDPDTAVHVEKGFVKMLKKLARTGGRVAIRQNKKVFMIIEIAEYTWAGKPRPKFRARFDKHLQADVRETHTEAIQERLDASDSQ